MKVTISICTWNRARLLDATLQRLAEAPVPGDVERTVLVADNNSSDMTRQVVLRHARELPVEYLFVPTPGKSHALNAAIERIDGEWILFIDDDVLVDRDWLSNYCAAIRRYPAASFLGGPIRPRFESSPPAWLLDVLPQIGGAFAVREFGSTPFRLDGARLPFGANFAIRTQVQQRFPYDPDLGRRADSMLAGEETAVLEQLLEAGEEGWWVPTAGVEHLITADRMTELYLRRFFAGLSSTQMIRLRASQPRGLWWCWHWGRAFCSEARFQVARRVARPATWVRALSRASRHWAKLGCSAGSPPYVPRPVPRNLAGRRLSSS